MALQMMACGALATVVYVQYRGGRSAIMAALMGRA
jgi:hypothetical protein